MGYLYLYEKAEGRRQGKRKKEKGKRQKAKGKRQKAKDKRQKRNKTGTPEILRKSFCT